MNWRAGQMVEIQEGEEARPGMPIMLVVDPSAMLVRVKVESGGSSPAACWPDGQDFARRLPGVGIPGRVEQVAPVGTSSRLTERVRNFVAMVSIQGDHPKLMPDLSAAVDVELERQENAIVVPRDAVTGQKGNFSVRVMDGGSRGQTRAVTLGSMNDHEVVVASGLEPGMTVQRMWRSNKRKIVGRLIAVAIVVGIAGVSGAFGRGDSVDVPTTAVTRGEFIDYLQVRGEVKAVRSIPLTAPSSAGDLQILELAKNGTNVKKGTWWSASIRCRCSARTRRSSRS